MKIVEDNIRTQSGKLRFQVLTETTVFWDVVPCSLAGVSENLTASIISEAVSSSETSVDIYKTTWRNIPEDSHLQSRKSSANF
jgi:hypothetical protein